MRNMDERLHLEPLDPGSADPGFWVRFHARVMDRARAELSRRRLVGEPSVADMVFAWRRTLVPLTLLAAALAGIVLVRGRPGEPAVAQSPVALEEALTEDLGAEPIPAVLARTEELDEVAFLAPGGGF